MKIKQNDIDHILDELQQKKITAGEANIRKIEMQRVLLVVGTIPAPVRKALNAGVKSGRLCHERKAGNRPEVFYKNGFKQLADTERIEYEKMILDAISSVMR